MNKANMKLWLLGSACAVCCAVPILVLLGIGGIGVGLIASDAVKEILICLIPVLLIVAVYLVLKKRRENACCVAATTECTSNKCGVPEK